MQISFVNDEYSSNIDEALSFAVKNGLKYIELRKIGDKYITDLSKDEAFALSQKIAEAGILVSAIDSSFLKWNDGTKNFNIGGQEVETEQEYFTQLMDLADIFGAPSIRIYSYVKQQDMPLETLGEKLDVYSQMALERGISLLLEPEKDCYIATIAQMHKLFELYNFSNIFPLLDLGNTMAWNDDYAPQDLQDLINMCTYFHIKDYDADLKRFVVIGEGNVDYENLLSDKFADNGTIFSLNTQTGYSEDLKMSLNMLQTLEPDTDEE